MFKSLNLWMDEDSALNYVAEVLFQTPKSVKRIRSSSDSDIDISPETRHPSKKIMSDYKDLNEKLLDDHVGVRDLLKSFIQQYQSDVSGLRSDIHSVKSSMVTQTKLTKELTKVRTEISEGCKAIKEELSIDITAVTSEVEKLETKINSFQSTFDKQLLELQSRINKIESGNIGVDFPIDTTCVISGLRYENGENLLEKCTDIIHGALGLNDIGIKNTKCTPMREGKPGIVKMELYNTSDKLLVLKNKSKLKDIGPLSRVRIRSSQSHEQRLLQQHTMELLKLQGKDQDYYFNGSGRLIKKTFPGVSNQNPKAQSVSNNEFVSLINGLSEKLNAIASSKLGSNN